jgi:O-antigen/teichoic acid export membrane protein
MWQALPLGITFIIFNVYSNVPRYFIAASLGDEQLGYFAAVLALVTSGVLVTQAASSAALPRLSRYYVTDRKAYIKLIGKLVVAGLGLGLIGLVIVVVFGKAILTVLFTSEYGEYYNLFVWSMVYGCLTYAVTFIGLGLTAMRFFRLQLIPYTLGLLAAACTCWLWIPAHGLIGAIFSLIFGKIFQALATVVIIALGIYRCPSRN